VAKQRRLLAGAYLTQEYALQAAAVTTPPWFQRRTRPALILELRVP